MKVSSVVNIQHLIQYLEEKGDQEEVLDAMKFYRAEFGTK